jgi:membrane protease YdiL (CAAX protease family)
MNWFFLDETQRLRTLWRFVSFGFGFLAVQIGISLVLAVGFVIYLVATGNTPKFSLTDPRSIETWMEEWTVTLQIIAAVPITLGTFGLVVVWRRYLDRRSVWSLGLGRPEDGFASSLVGGFLLGFAPIVFVIGILLVVGVLKWDGVSASLQTALLVPTFVVMAFFEEIVCRGYLLQNLIDIRRPVFGIAFSATVFWLLHALNPAAWSSPLIGLNLFGAGISLALAYRATGNIWFPTAMHFGWNFAEGVVFQVPVSGIRTDGLIDVHVVESAQVWLTGGRFGIEGSALTTFAEIWISVLLIGILVKRQKRAAEAVFVGG